MHVFFLIDQKNMGMSMKIERSTLDQVKKRFETNKKKKDEEKKQYGEKILVCFGLLYSMVPIYYVNSLCNTHSF